MRLKLFILSLFVCFLAKAQQTPVFAEYNYNPFLLNPGYAGLQASTEISITNSGFFKEQKVLCGKLNFIVLFNLIFFFSKC